MKLKNYLTVSLLILLFISQNANAQCDETNFRKIMTPQFAEDLAECKLTTRVEFVGMGSAGMRIPNKLKKKVIFRCVSPGEEPSKNQLSGQEVGYFCYGDKDNTSILFDLKKGDMIELTGIVFVNNWMGYKGANFICETIQKVE